MAAPQQHTLTNTSCTFPASPAVFTSGNYGGGQPASCSNLHDRLTGIANCDIQSVVYSSTAVVSQPVLGHTASRKTKPCSLCGTAAQRSQSSVVPVSPISPQEQPVVLLHRLEDGLPEGDVDSLRAFGTIRLLPVQRHCDKPEITADDSKHDCDRKYQSVECHSMSPGDLLYRSVTNRGNVKKRTEVAARLHAHSDRGGSLIKETKTYYSGSGDHYVQKYKPSEKTEKSSRSVITAVRPERDKGVVSRLANTKPESVYENSAGSKAVYKNSVGTKSVHENTVESKAVYKNSVGSKSAHENSVGSKGVYKYSVGSKSVDDNSVGSKVVYKSSVGSKSIHENSVGSKAVYKSSVGSKSVHENSVGSKELYKSSVGSKAVYDNSVGSRPVHENSIGSKSKRGQEVNGAHVKAAPHHFLGNPVSQSSHRVSSAQQRTPSSSQAEPLNNRSVITRSPATSNSSSSPQTSRSFTTAIHSHTSTSQAPSGTPDTAPRPSSTSTPMPVVCSPVVQLPSTTLSSSPPHNISSPSAISPPQSPPSLPSAFPPPPLASPAKSDSETGHENSSGDVYPSSPYSPHTLPSLPASPTSLPSSSDSPPSPAPSLESPPASPAASSDCRSENSHIQALGPCAERLGDSLPSDTSACVAKSGTVPQSRDKVEHRKVKDRKVVSQCHLSQVSSMESAGAPANKSSTDHRHVTQVASVPHSTRAPSSSTHTPEATCAASQNSKTTTQVDSLSETSRVYASDDKKENAVAAEQLSPDLTKCLLNSESVSADTEKSSGDYTSSLMKLVLKVKHHGSQQPQLGSEKKECNKESVVPKIVLTLTGKGPNKEYSCSNRIRHDSETRSENTNNKKHKSKKSKRDRPKDRERSKKIVKGDKHKRHLELFGEDSNDSCDNNADSPSDYHSETIRSRTPSLEEQEIDHSTKPLSPGESVVVHGEKDLPASAPERESSSTIVRVEEKCKTKEEENWEDKDPPAGPVDDSVSLSSSQVQSPNLETNGTVEDSVNDLPSAEDNKETPVGQVDSIENSTKDSVKEVAEAPEVHDTRPPHSESENTEEIETTSSSMLQASALSHPSKESEGLILRSPKNRHAKNTESGRNSDACLWVSFGVNAPMPLPAVDQSTIKRIFASKERIRQRESVSAESKGSVSNNEPSNSVAEKSISKASHKDNKERQKIEHASEVTKETKERRAEEKAKYSQPDFDHKHDYSSSAHRSHSSSSHRDSSHVRSRVRSRDDSEHRRHRHSHKRSRKSEESRERAAKKEVQPCRHNSWRPTHKDDTGSQEVSINTHKGKYAAVSAQTKSAEKIVTTTPSSHPKVSSAADEGPRVQDTTDTPPRTVEKVQNKETSNTPCKKVDNFDKPKDSNTEESADDQYYRPKKIRKIFHTSTIKDHCNDMKPLEPTKDDNTQGSTTQDSTLSPNKICDTLQSPVETVPAPLEPHATDPEPSTAETAASALETGAQWKPQEMTSTEKQPNSPRDAEAVREQRQHKQRSPTPQEQEPVARVEEQPGEEAPRPTAEKERVAGKPGDSTKESVQESEEHEKQELEKKERERRKRARRERRRDYTGVGGRSSVLQEVQHRREVEHEEERGRRLAQEIKGFNWLEQKIKNGSLLSSSSAPSTPTTTSPVAKEAETISRTLSTPAATPASQLSAATREEVPAKKRLLSVSSGGVGLKGHLQTAVPPLIPSSKVTALPKRRPSLGTPTTPPCSAPSALSSVTSVPSMTVQGALYTREPTPNRSEHGRVGPALETSSIVYEHEHTGHDKATLYSSTTSSKATLYGVKDDNFQTLYDTVSVHPVSCYGAVNSVSTEPQYTITAAPYTITASPVISFYGSAKYQESNPGIFSLAASSYSSSVISSPSSSSTLRDHHHHSLHPPTSNAHLSKDSDWSAKQEANTQISSKPTGSSEDSHCSQRFSHKQALLRRAFQEMLKSEHNTSSTEQPKASQDLPEPEMKKADVPRDKETEAVAIAANQPSSESTSPPDSKSTSLKLDYSDNAPPPNPASKSADTTDSSTVSYSQEPVTPSVKLDKELAGPLHDEGKNSSSATEGEEIANNISCKLEPSDSDQIKKSETPDVEEDISNKNDTSKKNSNEADTTKLTEGPKELENNIIDTIVSTSGVINVKVLKDEITPMAEDKNKEDPVQSTLLLSVLYKELLKTRQEVEKLRKVQELMLTEKGEKREDASEQSIDDKAESEKTDENANRSERVAEKRKEEDESNNTELKPSDHELHHDSKRLKSKISIRNDLLSEEDVMAVDTTSSDTSPSQNNIPQPQQVSSPTLASPTVIQSDSEVLVITLESPAIPEASHLSRVSPVITAASPVLSNSISGSPNISSASPRGHARTSPGMPSPGMSRTSPGAPRTSPALPRASPGMPLSNITSPGLPGSPGLQKSSPGIPRSSPGVLRMSPGLARPGSAIQRASPGTPASTPGSSGLESTKTGAEIISVSPVVSPLIIASTPSNVINPPTNPSPTNNLQIYSHSATATVQPKMTIVQSVTSPVGPIPGYAQTPATSTAVSITSPPGARVSPHLPKIDVTTSKTDASLKNMSPTKLRSVFGISSSEVELMPIPSSGAKYSPHDTQSQAFLKAIEDSHHQITETPLLMNAVRGMHRESSCKDTESSAGRGPMPYHSLPCTEDPRRAFKAHQYESGVKQHAFSTSDLPDHPASVCKQPPPLKPVSALLRRHSENMEIQAALHHATMFPGAHKSLTNSLHPSTSTAEPKSSSTIHPFDQTSVTPSQYPMSGPSRRRNSDSSSSERSQEYQQAVSMGMQHPYPHLPPGASLMRSLGPDKASIFPIPPAMHPSMRGSMQFKPPPTVTRAQREYPSENFYRSNFSFFEKIREKVAGVGDGGIGTMPPVATAEKPIHPQTFAPRVLVRESVPEGSSHIPTSTFSTLHFPNPNQPMPNVMPGHQNHFLGSIHPATTIHHAAQARLHPSANQAAPNTQRNATGSGGEKLCFRCSQPARFVCSGCKKAWYCSEHCQRDDWSTHGVNCVL